MADEQFGRTRRKYFARSPEAQSTRGADLLSAVQDMIGFRHENRNLVPTLLLVSNLKTLRYTIQ
jgi:hypothetical protein